MEVRKLASDRAFMARMAATALRSMQGICQTVYRVAGEAQMMLPHSHLGGAYSIWSMPMSCASARAAAHMEQADRSPPDSRTRRRRWRRCFYWSPYQSRDARGADDLRVGEIFLLLHVLEGGGHHAAGSAGGGGDDGAGIGVLLRHGKAYAHTMVFLGGGFVYMTLIIKVLGLALHMQSLRKLAGYRQARIYGAFMVCQTVKRYSHISGPSMRSTQSDSRGFRCLRYSAISPKLFPPYTPGASVSGRPCIYGSAARSSPAARQRAPVALCTQNIHGVWMGQIAGLQVEIHLHRNGGPAPFDGLVGLMAPRRSGPGTVQHHAEGVGVWIFLLDKGRRPGGTHGVGAGGRGRCGRSLLCFSFCTPFRPGSPGRR